MDVTPGLGKKILCWGVHLYTAMGLVCAAAIAACIVHGNAADFRTAFLLMVVALFVDATDGTMARRLHIKEVLPGFDGRKLDDITDFLTYTALPLLLLWRADAMPVGWNWSLVVALVASAYGFCQTEAKTDDGYFLGFPSLWNIVAFYLYLMPAPGWAAAATILSLAALTFVPFRYLYPSQGGKLNLVTNVLGGIWSVMLVWIFFTMPTDGRPGETVFWAAFASLFFPVFYMAASWAVTLKVFLAGKQKAKSRFDAVICDMDGTLADTEPLHHQAYKRVLATLGTTITDAEYDKFTGRTDDVICRYLIERDKMSLSVEDLLALKEKAFRQLVRGTLTPLPGVVKMLHYFKDKGLKLAVASASTKEDIDTVLGALGIRDLFDAIASGVEVENSKPAPDVFLLAAKRVNAMPTRCLAFEDSENGTIAAHTAAMFCIAVPCPSTRHQDHSAANLKVGSMEELDLDAISAVQD